MVPRSVQTVPESVRDAAKVRPDHAGVRARCCQGCCGFRMGKPPDRQDFIIENLREDLDKLIEVAVA